MSLFKSGQFFFQCPIRLNQLFLFLEASGKDLILVILINEYTDLVGKTFDMIMEALTGLCPLVSDSYKVVD